MTPDFVDRAFLRRLADSFASEAAAVTAAPRGILPDRAPPQPPDDPVVARLLEACPEQWERLVDRLEEAWAAGDRVVAVAGRTRGEGRSIVVRGLMHLVHGRGGNVVCHERTPSPFDATCGPGDSDGPVLVDAGVWFPPGPVHRGRLARAAFGCQAAVLVRRADRHPCPAHEAALAALGIRILGEVVTFADATRLESGTG